MKSAGHVASLRDRKGANRVLVRKPEGKRSLGMLGVDGRTVL
jgi:hypothetical protein